MALLVIGTDDTQSALGWNCGACGLKTCGDFNKHAKQNKDRGTAQGGPSCMWQLVDFGTSVCTAAAAVYAAGVPTRSILWLQSAPNGQNTSVNGIKMATNGCASPPLWAPV